MNNSLGIVTGLVKVLLAFPNDALSIQQSFSGIRSVINVQYQTSLFWHSICVNNHFVLTPVEAKGFTGIRKSNCHSNICK